MRRDRYDNPLSTASDAARDAYILATDRLLAAQGGAVAGFEAAVQADSAFALGHAGLARASQIAGDGAGARSAMKAARGLSKGLTAREAGHIDAMGLLLDGQTAKAYPAIRAHVADHPCDAIVAQTCSSVFGLIGFSGRPGREAEILAYTSSLLPHYGDDWWAQSQYAFALCENGELDRAGDIIHRAQEMNPANANGAHVISHVQYETGQTDAGVAYLTDWLAGYGRDGALHGHLSWHTALWALEQGDIDAMWARVDADVGPDGSGGLPINILTDTASLMYRAELAGVQVAPERWAALSAYATACFPAPGLGFIDLHVAIAHAMAGDGAALARLSEAPHPVFGDLVVPISHAYAAFARQNWAEGVEHLTPALASAVRLGGSRAQRDVLEVSMLNALLRMGRAEEAQRLLALRRPVLSQSHLVGGIMAHVAGAH